MLSKEIPASFLGLKDQVSESPLCSILVWILIQHGQISRYMASKSNMARLCEERKKVIKAEGSRNFGGIYAVTQVR